MLDKCAVAGDITQAIDRRGAWSCAITVIGGTGSTAVKLQSCATADGTFEDFKTLIPSAEASASQYKGFVVDISGAGNFIKVTGATMATCVLGDCDHDVKTVAIKAGEIPSGADLEDNKTATIDVSTYTEPVEITPTAGKDGMKKATVTLSNIPSPSSGGSFHNINDETISTVEKIIRSVDVVAFRMLTSDNHLVKGSIMGGDGDGGTTVSACGMKDVDFWEQPSNCFFNTGFDIGYISGLDWDDIATTILNSYNTSTGDSETFTRFEIYY